MSEKNDANALSELGRSRQARRSFLKQALGVGAAGAGLSALGQPALAQIPGGLDAAILNFALNLEYLEAEYYNYAVTGNSITAQGIGINGSGMLGGVKIKANPQVPFATPVFKQYATEIAVDEAKHVAFLRATLMKLGVQQVARPALDLQTSFQALLGANFDPFANEANFLIGAYIFEDVGVSAYHGAAPLLKNGNILGAAAGILAVEAYHSGSIRTLLNFLGQQAATDAISAARLSLGGGPDYGVDKGIVVADDNALATSRTYRQVLNIVYGGAGILATINIGLAPGALAGQGGLAFQSSTAGFLTSALDPTTSNPFNSLYRFDISTGKSTLLTGTTDTLEALAFGAGGTLYGLGKGDGTLYTVNTNSGALTLVGNVGFGVGSPTHTPAPGGPPGGPLDPATGSAATTGFFSISGLAASPAAVPEPSSLALCGVFTALAGGHRLIRRRKAA